jgi:hypothetical protein
MALDAASDALGNLGLDWQMIADRVVDKRNKGVISPC